jgi:Rieske Fe-S protein
MVSCNRRTFLVGIGAIAAPMLAACGSDSVTAAPVAPAEAYRIDGNDVVVSVDRIPTLAANEQPVVLLAARLIVVRAAADRFRALSVECPHSGCAVSNVSGSKLVCPCHGSEFDSSGRRLAGPAPTGLTELTSTFDAESRTLRVSRRA